MKHILISLLLFPVAMPALQLAAAEPTEDMSQLYRRADTAIDKGLSYLASIQLNEDNSQEVPTTVRVPPSAGEKRRRGRYARSTSKIEKVALPELIGSIAINKPGNTGITSLSIMAFLAKGHVPGRGSYGDNINLGIDYILDQADDQGLLVSKNRLGRATRGTMYSHCISTLLLAEVSGMVDPQRQQRIDKVLPDALAVILNAHKAKKENPLAIGGWRYSPTSNSSDLSLTGWAVMALRAGKLNGAEVPEETIEQAVEYILRCRSEVSGGFAYVASHVPRGGNLGLTGVGILCLELCGQHGHAAIRPAGEFMKKNFPVEFNGSMQTYYGYYYVAQAAFQLGPEYWADFAPDMYNQLLSAQLDNGQWPPTGGLHASACGAAYSTSLAILAMTPPYRQLPIYQRVEGD